jgi:hypothetical protein
VTFAVLRIFERRSAERERIDGPSAAAEPPPAEGRPPPGAAEVVIQRAGNHWIDAARSYEVLIDGVVRTRVARGQERTVSLDAGEHEIQLRVDWARSRPLSIDVPSEARIVLRCWPRTNLLTHFWWSTRGRDDYIAVVEVE